MRASVVMSNFIRAIILWAGNLIENPEVSPLERRRVLLKIKRVAEFTSSASPDTLQFGAGAQAAIIIIKRNIQLQHWKVDLLSKSNLSTEKFSGRLLVGESGQSPC